MAGVMWAKLNVIHNTVILAKEKHGFSEAGIYVEKKSVKFAGNFYI